MICSKGSVPAVVCLLANRVLGLTAGTTILFFLICLPISSQTNQGRIQGGVFDQTGGVIAGATVAVTDVARGVARTLVTDSAGEYSAISLVPGTYTVRGEAKGFKAVEHTNVLVQVGEDIRVDLTLQPGEQTQTVTVTADIPLVETTNATLGGALSNETINDLPLNGRDFTNLVTLRPGVVAYPGGGDHANSGNGSTPRDGLWLLDGALAYNPVNGGQIVNYRYQAGPSSSTLPVDAIQEFNTQENPRAEYGWAVGALINVGLKSGTNSLHGTAYAFGRGTALDARNYFNQPTLSDGSPNPKTPVELEQYGATAGGPIIKDKLFWFVGYEGEQLSVGDIYVGAAPASVSLPSFVPATPGQFGCTGTLLNAPGNCNASIVDACNDIGRANVNALSALLAGLPAAGCIPQPASSTFENVFPFNPGTNPQGPTVFAPFPLPNTTTENNGIVKLTYHINDHQTLSGSYFIADMPNALWVTSPDQLTNLMQNFITVRTRVFGSNWTYTPNSTWVNELRVGTNSIAEIDTGPDNKNSQALPWPTGFGIPTGVSNPSDFGMPYLQISSLNNFALGHGSTTRFRGPGGTTEIGDNISYLHGKHAFKFGGDFFYLRLADDNLRQVQGRIKFDDIESFLSGKPHKGNILTGNPQVRQRDASVAGFVQDDWRATKTLTLNLGLRYEFMPPSWEIDNQFGSFDPSLGLVQGWTVHPDYRNISPRLGVAWDINGNAKTVVRAAGSIIYQTADFYAGLGDGATGVPFGYDVVVNGVTKPGSQAGSGSATFSKSDLSWNTTGPIFPPVVGRLQCGDGVGADPGPCDTNFVDPNIRTPRVTNWNLDVQRALTTNLTLDVAYVGNHSHGEARSVQINQPAIGAGWFSPLAQNPGNGTPGSGTGAVACLASAPLYNNCGVFNPYNTPLQPLYNQFPYIGFLDETKNVGFSNFNALQVTLTQRRFHGLYFLAAYSYSHGLDDFYGAPPQRGGLQDNANPGLDYGTSDYDIKHRFTLSLTYAFPDKKSPAQLLEGWSLNSIVTLQSGLPWGPTDTNNDFPGTNALNDSSQASWDFKGNPSDFTSGPNVIPCFGNLQGCTPYATVGGIASPPAACMSAAQANGPLAIASLMNLGCYVKGNSVLTPPAYGSLGNMSRNMFRDSGFRDWDFSILKDWKFKERLNAQFRAEFFNILNHPNFANPYGAFTTYYNNDPSTGNGFGCGCITPDAAAGNFVLGSGGARDVQLGLKLTF